MSSYSGWGIWEWRSWEVPASHGAGVRTLAVSIVIWRFHWGRRIQGGFLPRLLAGEFNSSSHWPLYRWYCLSILTTCHLTSSRASSLGAWLARRQLQCFLRSSFLRPLYCCFLLFTSLQVAWVLTTLKEKEIGLSFWKYDNQRICRRILKPSQVLSR